MPEDQAPFAHQDGSVSPRRGAPSLRLLSSISLERQIRAITGAAAFEDAGLDRATETLQLLREPGINAVVTAMASMPEADAAILGDVATALLAADRRRPRLILALRAALESVS